MVKNLPANTGAEQCLVAQSCPTLYDSMDCSLPGSSVHGDSPGKNTRVGHHAFLQGIFSNQGLNLSHERSPRMLEWVAYSFSCLQCRRCGFNPRSGRSPGEGNVNPLQYSCPLNPVDRGAWWATCHPWGCKESDAT